MPNRPLTRLLFSQGGLCFFCEKPLPVSDASVEHLVARSNGGTDKDENCVACCKSVNVLLGCRPLKEKLQLVLNAVYNLDQPPGTITWDVHQSLTDPRRYGRFVRWAVP